MNIILLSVSHFQYTIVLPVYIGVHMISICHKQITIRKLCGNISIHDFIPYKPCLASAIIWSRSLPRLWELLVIPVATVDWRTADSSPGSKYLLVWRSGSLEIALSSSSSPVFGRSVYLIISRGVTSGTSLSAGLKRVR